MTGVADVQVYGTQSQIFEIDVDQVKLASLGLTVGDIRNALATIAFDSPAGSINGANQNINVRAIAEVTTPEQFEDIIINGKTRLRDVATRGLRRRARRPRAFAPTASRASASASSARRSPTPSRISDGVHAAVADMQDEPAARSRASRSRATMPSSSAARCTRSSAR